MGESLGVRGTDHAHLVFDGTPVPVENRLGEEGAASQVAFGGFLTPSRIAVAMTCVGLARKAQELAVEHAPRARHLRQAARRAAGDRLLAGRERRRHRGRAAARPARGAREWEAGSPDAAVLSSMAKLTAVDMLTRVTDKALQVARRRRLLGVEPIERVYRDARAQRFEEGTNEIQKTIIARDHPRRAGSREPGLRGREGRASSPAARAASAARWPSGSRARAPPSSSTSSATPTSPRRPSPRSQEAGGKAIAVQADMEDPEEIERLFDEAREEYGRLDYFVANAAAAAFKPIERAQGPPPRPLLRDERPRLRARRAAGRVELMDDGGRIVVLSSYGSIRAYPTYAALGAAKAAIEAFVRYMAVEFGPRGINVNAVNGGIIESDSSDYFYGVEGMPPLEQRCCRRSPRRRMGTVQEVADCDRVPARTALGVRHRADAGRRRRAEHRRAAVLRRRDGSARPARHDAGMPDPAAESRYPRRAAAPIAIGALAAAAPDRDGVDAPRVGADPTR